MPEQPIIIPPSQRLLASAEADLFGALLGFHKKAMTLLRQSSLDDEQLKVVAARINSLLENSTVEVGQTKPLAVGEQLETAYEDVKRLVEKLSGSRDGGIEG